MNEDLLKNLLRLKISLAQRVTEALPEAVQKSVKELETQMMHVLYDIAKEYVEKVPDSENTKQAGGLKTIEVM